MVDERAQPRVSATRSGAGPGNGPGNGPALGRSSRVERRRRRRGELDGEPRAWGAFATAQAEGAWLGTITRTPRRRRADVLDDWIA